MNQNDLDQLETQLKDLQKTIRKLGMARANLHDIDIAIQVVGRVKERMQKKRSA